MSADRQNDLLGRILEPIGQCLTPDGARELLNLRADAAAQQRMEELAERANEGKLTEEERAEYDSYIAAANVIAILQAKARRLLGPKPA